MFFNLKVCLTTCFCTLKEIKVGSHEISWNKKLLLTVSHDLWAQNRTLLSVGFEILGLGKSVILVCAPKGLTDAFYSCEKVMNILVLLSISHI